MAMRVCRNSGLWHRFRFSMAGTRKRVQKKSRRATTLLALRRCGHQSTSPQPVWFFARRRFRDSGPAGIANQGRTADSSAACGCSVTNHHAFLVPLTALSRAHRPKSQACKRSCWQSP
jgi:hypothetical protein